MIKDYVNGNIINVMLWYGLIIYPCARKDLIKK